MTIGAQGFQVCGVIVLVIAICMVYIKLTRMRRHKPTFFARWLFMSNVFPASGGHSPYYVVPFFMALTT